MMQSNEPINQAQRLKPGERQRQILDLLKYQGPMSAPIIGELLEPAMDYKQTYEVMQSLLKRKLINPRRSLGYPERYFQIRQKPKCRLRVSRFLGCTPEDVHHPQYRYVHGRDNDAIGRLVSA